MEAAAAPAESEIWRGMNRSTQQPERMFGMETKESSVLKPILKQNPANM